MIKNEHEEFDSYTSNHIHSEKYKNLLLDQNGFEKIRDYLLEQTGIKLSSNSQHVTLVASRLMKIMDKYKVSSYVDILYLVKKNQNDFIFREFIHALTTNTSYFFREESHFQILNQYFPILKEENAKKGEFDFRLWCAASSYGQEAYSILISLFESRQLKTGDLFKILASDIDLSVLQEACRGVYSDEDVQKISHATIQKYFKQLAPREKLQIKRYFQVKKNLRDFVTFSNINLIELPYDFKNLFHVVFCRNVLIYFLPQMALKVIEALASTIKPGGLLFVGLSETSLVQNEILIPIAPGVYQKRMGEK